MRGEEFTLTLSTLGQRATASIELTEGETITITNKESNIISGYSSLLFIQPPENAQPIAIYGFRTLTAPTSGAYQIGISSDETNEFTGSIVFDII